jgi:hypothetical protein
MSLNILPSRKSPSSSGGRDSSGKDGLLVLSAGDRLSVFEALEPIFRDGQIISNLFIAFDCGIDRINVIEVSV